MSRIAGALAALVLCACAMQTGSLPERAADSLVALPDVAVGYEVQARKLGIESADLVGFYRSRLEPLLPRVFASVAVGRGKAPLYLRFKFDDTADSDFYLFTNFLCFATLSAFPCYFQNDYTLDLEAEREGKPLERFHYETTVKTLMWLPVAPVSLVRSPRQVESNAVDELITNALADLSAKIEATPPTPANGE